MVGLCFLFIICLRCNIFTFHDEHSGEAFAQNITTTRISFCLQRINLGLCQNLAKPFCMEECINNEEFHGITLWKGITVGLHDPGAVLFTYRNEKIISLGGEHQFREFYRLQLKLSVGLRQFDAYKFAKQFYFQPSDVTLLRPISCIFYNPALNFNTILEVNYWHIVIFLCVNLPWNSIFMLLIWFLLFGKFRSRRLRYTRYRGHIWSRRKIY